MSDSDKANVRYTVMSDVELSQAENDPRTDPTERAAITKEIQRRAAVRSRLGIRDEPITQRVVVKDIDMPFMSMVSFMVKWAIAAIPALVILSILWLLVAGFFAALFRR